MPTSKLLLWTFLVLNLAGLTACNIPSPQSHQGTEGTEAATFFITDAKGDSLTSKLNKDFAIPKSKTFNFSVCLKDQGQSKPLIGHPFRIIEIQKDLKSDEKGCLNWMEEVPFNFFAEPTYLEWKRQITATGLHRGSRLVRFAINPWNDTDKSQAVLNLANITPPRLVSGDNEVKAVLAGESKEAHPLQNTLWVNDMRVQSNEQKFTTEGVIINMELMAIPQLQIHAINGENVLRPISQGRFKTKLYLIHSVVENNEEKNRILAESSPETSEIRSGNLFIKAPLKLTMIPTRGQLILGLDISADDMNKSIGHFQGIYLIGDYDQIKGSGFLKLMSIVTQKPGFQLSKFINAKLDEKLSSTSERIDGYVKPRIEINPLDISFLRVAKESTAEREIIYNVKACFKNGIEQKVTRGYGFKVTGFRQNDQAGKIIPNVNVDNMGCINWDESIKFKFHECHKSLLGTIDIENQDLALKESLRVALNPWDIGAKGRDLRFPYSEEHIITDCKKENILPSTLSLRSFSYSTLSYTYDIDSYLNMSVNKKIRIKLDAVVSNFSDMSNGRSEGAQKLRPGVYLLKLALIKNRDYYNQKTYITSSEKLISTLDGDIKADILFKTADLKALGNRNTLLVELDPVLESKVTVNQNGDIVPKEHLSTLDEVIDRSTGLYRRTFFSTMTLNLDKDSADLAPLSSATANAYLTAEKLPPTQNNKSVVREYIIFGQQLAKEQQDFQKAQMDLDLYAKKNSLKIVTASHFKNFPDLRSNLSQAPTQMTDSQINQELQYLATTGKMTKNLARGLCGYWFKNYIRKDIRDWNIAGQNALLHCALRANRPEQLFSLEKRLFVKELGGFSHVGGFNSGITVGNNLTLSRSHANSNYVTKSLNFNLGMSHKFAEFFSIGMSGSYAIAQSTTDAVTSANSTSVTTNISPFMQQNIFQLKFNRYHECAIVRINPTLFMENGEFGTTLNPSYSDAQRADVATRGLMVCTGQDNTKPILRTESYYLIAQENPSSNANTQDPGDDINRQFFVALRSTKEFERLMYFMKGVIKKPITADRDSSEQKNISKGLHSLFNTGTTNIPGAYNDTRP